MTVPPTVSPLQFKGHFLDCFKGAIKLHLLVLRGDVFATHVFDFCRGMGGRFDAIYIPLWIWGFRVAGPSVPL